MGQCPEEHLETLYRCVRCSKELPGTAFEWYRDSRYRRPRCRPCGYRWREERDTSTKSLAYALGTIAPRRAAARLIEQNSEALALIVQRYRAEFEPLLSEERAKAVARREKFRVAHENHILRSRNARASRSQMPVLQAVGEDRPNRTGVGETPPSSAAMRSA